MKYESSLTIPSHQNIIALSAEVRQVYESVPMPVKLRSIA